MIDPLVSLAFSISSNKGTYAMLVGSGISRSAGIPTGWEITLELVEKLAAASGAETNGDAEQWFRDTQGKEPDYSELLDGLAKSAVERQQYLKGFFEPTEQEREEGLKQPTDAHHAIADLMQQGFVKVVVTTNFDRLLEQALEARGIVPTVVSNADQVRGMLPLVHQDHCIIKVHGDYLDTRIKNTGQELESYSSELDDLLDQVIDQFGLITCGWSGDWDPALRAAIERAPARRFSSYWASRGQPSATAEKLIRDRGLHSIKIADADSFFRSLADNVKALNESSRPHPLTAQAAVASAKTYLAEDKHRIRLNDLLLELDDDARVRWSNSGIGVSSPEPKSEAIAHRIKLYDETCEVLLRVAMELGRWARPEQYSLATNTLRRLATVERGQGQHYPFWVDLSRYPATLFLYAAGMSALQSGNLELLGDLLSAPIRSSHRTDHPAVARLLPMVLLDDHKSFNCLFEGNGRHTPGSDWVAYSMRRLFAPHTSPSELDDEFLASFDEFEMLAAIAHRSLTRSERARAWFPYGSWGWRHQNAEATFTKLQEELDAGRSRIVQLNVLEQGEVEAGDILNEMRAFRERLPLF